jgi:hypothetical protein
VLAEAQASSHNGFLGCRLVDTLAVQDVAKAVEVATVAFAAFWALSVVWVCKHRPAAVVAATVAR